MGKVLTILMSFSACTSPRHILGAYLYPRLRSLLSLSLGLLVSVPLRGTTSYSVDTLTTPHIPLNITLHAISGIECWVLD